MRVSAPLGVKHGAANFAELGHYAIGRRWGSSDPRTANVVPKYYGVNTFDETFTPAGNSPTG